MYAIELMVNTIVMEASSESFEGMLGVAYVITNRFTDTRWPNDIAKVILQDKQFSCWNDKDPNHKRALLLASDSSTKLKAFAAAILAFYSLVADPTNGANHYHASSVSPGWSKAPNMTKTVEIGRHIFYRMER